MDNNRKIAYILFFLIGTIIYSCENMNDIHKEFIEGGEKIYPGRVDSLNIYPGNERVKLSWLLMSDQNITSCRVYWNNGTDFKEIPIKKTPNVDTIETIIDGLAEGVYSFEVYSLHKDGAMSVKEEKIGVVYGENYIKSLNNRFLSESRYNDSSNTLTLNWGISPVGSVGSEIKYKDMSDKEFTKRIEINESKTEILNIAAGSIIEQRTLYLPEALAIDTIYSSVNEIISITLTPEPITAKFSADRISILSGGTIAFTDESEGEPTTWEWEFIPESGTTITSSEQNPVITFVNEGIYTVKLTASKGYGAYSDVITEENYITVRDPSSVAIADFSADKILIYTGKEVEFTDLSKGTITNWEWTFEGATPASSTEQNPTVTYNETGKYKVTLVASNETENSTMEKSGYITVVPGDGLVTLIPFDGSLEDISSLNLEIENIHDAILFDGVDRNGSRNKTAVFDGTSYLKIQPHADKQFVGSYSVGIWMKTDNSQQAWLWTEGRQNDVAAWFRINPTSFSFLPQLGGIFSVNTQDGPVLHDNAWHYVMCIRNADENSAQIYVNGILVAERSLTATSLSNDHGFYIGAQNLGVDNVSNFFKGQLDDLVIYNKALTEDEIILLSEF